MPEQLRATWEEIEAQLFKIDQKLEALQSEVRADTKVGGRRLLQQVTLLAGLVDTLNIKLDAEIERRRG